MIGVIDVEIQAANPSMPLFPIRAFQGSPSSVRVRNVPKKIGKWNIEKVYASIAYPDNTTHTVECKLTGGIYVGTISGCGTIGKVENGYSIFADGTDENGAAVTNYCLGKGDVQILDARGITHPLQNTTFVQILSARPDSPNDGDMWQDDGSWYIWQDGQAWAIGDESGAIGELTERVDDLEEDKQDKLSDAQMAIINNAIEETKTVVKYRDGTISKFDIVGVIEDSRVISNLDEVVEIKFGNTVTQIMKEHYGAYEDVYSFTLCPYLSSVTIPDSVKMIGEHAFANCTNLTSVTIPNSVTSIGGFAFEYSGLTSVTIPESVTSIDGAAFRGCTGLVDVTIPDSVTNIEQIAFSGCTSLTNVVARNAEFGTDSFRGCTSLGSIEIGGRIGQGSFYGCTSLTDVTMYYGVDKIGASAFEGCTALVNVQFGDKLNEISYQAFKGCTSLVSIKLPDSLTKIYDGAFENCTALHVLDIGNYLQTIGASAFKNCSALNQNRFVYLPNSITTIGADAFATNSATTTLVFIDGKT